MRVDGLVQLDDGKLVLVEMKYALNWKNACNARIEIQRFLYEEFCGRRWFEVITEHKKKKIDRALIIFHHFAGDWKLAIQENIFHFNIFINKIFHQS